LNKWNPLANIINAGLTFLTGEDSYGVKQSNTEASIQLASAIPIFKLGKVANVLGSTGRVVAKSLTEQLAMQEIMSNPSMGRVIIPSISDPRWSGWSKMTNEAAHGVEIHYLGKWQNGILTAVDDFKFK
jgi:hypothetical protein